MSFLLRIENASFGYGRKVVLSDVDLAVDPGDFVGLLGPNGAGKTTLFRGILGLLPALSGKVAVNAASIGYVPQREALDPIFPLTALEVVHMGAYGRLTGWRRLSRRDRDLAHECLARVDLEGRATDSFASLSGGQRQRVLIARALMVRPKLLLLDEPTSGVDESAVRTITALLSDLAAHEDMAIMLVSHQLGVLRDVVSEVLWVANGHVELHSPAELLAPGRLEQLFSPEAKV